MSNGTKALTGALTCIIILIVMIAVLPLIKFVLEIFMAVIIIAIAVGGFIYVVAKLHHFFKTAGGDDERK